jgi:hypothetical protein
MTTIEELETSLSAHGVRRTRLSHGEGGWSLAGERRDADYGFRPLLVEGCASIAEAVEAFVDVVRADVDRCDAWRAEAA